MSPFVILAAAVCGQQNGAAEYRDYADGPLTARDFQAAIPDMVMFRGQLALTNTELRYDFKFRLNRSAGRTTASVTSIDFRAVVLPGRCWNRAPEDLRLLDHEQGHFDITYIAALRARRRYSALKRVTGRGASDEQAVQDLRKKLDERLRIFAKELSASQTEYDDLTRHGTALDQQQEQRQRQKREIDELTGVRKSENENVRSREDKGE